MFSLDKRRSAAGGPRDTSCVDGKSASSILAHVPCFSQTKYVEHTARRLHHYTAPSLLNSMRNIR